MFSPSTFFGWAISVVAGASPPSPDAGVSPLDSSPDATDAGADGFADVLATSLLLEAVVAELEPNEKPEEPDVEPKLEEAFDDDATGSLEVTSLDCLDSSYAGLLPNMLVEDPPKDCDGFKPPPKLNPLEPGPVLPKAGNKVLLPALLLPKGFEAPAIGAVNELDLPIVDVLPKPLPEPNGVAGLSAAGVPVNPNGDELLEAVPNGDGFEGPAAGMPNGDGFESIPEEPAVVDLPLSSSPFSAVLEEAKVNADGVVEEGIAAKLGLKPPVGGAEDELEEDVGAGKPAKALGGVGIERGIVGAGTDTGVGLDSEDEDVPFTTGDRSGSRLSVRSFSTSALYSRYWSKYTLRS